MPERFESSYNYPLVVWLHSQESSEFELDGLMPHLSMRNYISIAVRGTATSRSHDRKFGWSQSPTSTALAEELVLQSVESACSDLPIHPSRIFIAGYGAGGTMAQWIGLKHSHIFSGIVSINGIFPRRPRSLTRWKEARRTPVLFQYGLQSRICNMDQVCHALKQSHQCALPFQFLQFDTGDELTTGMTDVANQFFMQIVNNKHPVNCVSNARA